MSEESPKKTTRKPRTKPQLSPLQEAAAAEKELARIDAAIAKLSEVIPKLNAAKVDREKVVSSLSDAARGLLLNK